MIHEAMIKDTISWIVNNLEGKLGISDVASRVGYSRGHLQRLFKCYVGESLACFIRRHKLKLALIDIVQSEQRILDVALKFGFESHATFTRAFNKAYGCPPNKIRAPGVRQVMLDSISLFYSDDEISFFNL